MSRVSVELFNSPHISNALAFRGGTALHKLCFPIPGRYSEDVDLVQCSGGAIGPTLDAIRAQLDSWLGEAKTKQSEGRAALFYRFDSTTAPIQPMRVKIEINTREHFTVLGIRQVPFSVDSPWFTGKAQIQTFHVEELLGTKLRALYQRKMGRDLYDLSVALSTAGLDDDKVVACFLRYMAHGKHVVTRDVFKANLSDKLQDAEFLGDIGPLLADPSAYDATAAAEVVLRRLVSKLPQRSRKPRPHKS